MARYPDGDEAFADYFIVEPVPRTVGFARDIAMGMTLEHQGQLVNILDDWAGRSNDEVAKKIGCSTEMAGALRTVYQRD